MPNERLGDPGNKKVVVFVAVLTFLISIDKMLNKNLTTSFTSALPSALLPAVQKTSLLIDAISKLFYHTNLRNYNTISLHLKCFINYKQYRRTAHLMA